MVIADLSFVGLRSLCKPIPPEDRETLRVISLGMTLAVVDAFVMPSCVPSALLFGSQLFWFYFGIALLIAGSFLRRHCFRVLSSFFTGAITIQSNQKVIDTGAYRRVRHPSYTAALVIVLGLRLSLGNWLGAASSFLIALAAYSYRAQIEEQVLICRLGASYEAFKISRKQFIPYIL